MLPLALMPLLVFLGKPGLWIGLTSFWSALKQASRCQLWMRRALVVALAPHRSCRQLPSGPGSFRGIPLLRSSSPIRQLLHSLPRACAHNCFHLEASPQLCSYTLLYVLDVHC